MGSLKEELRLRAEKVRNFLLEHPWLARLSPPHIREAVESYVRAGGKALRPAFVLFSCGAVGGEEDKALPVAAGIEIFHTFTLVHDDIIDRDELRRGAPTVHTAFKGRAMEEFGFGEEEAEHYGISMGILAGDAQHGWAIGLIVESARRGVSPEVVLKLVEGMTCRVLPTLVEGQVLDVQYAARHIEELSSEEITDMLWKKTGALYAFAAEAGAMVGLNAPDEGHSYVRALSDFASRCGTAFQLVDDILGVTGDEGTLGKPVGSDIREGKKTLVAYFALRYAEPELRERVLSILGRRDADEDEVQKVRSWFVESGAVDMVRALATKYMEEGMEALEALPPSDHRERLRELGEYILRRER